MPHWSSKLIVLNLALLLASSSCIPQQKPENVLTPTETTHQPRSEAEQYIVQGDFNKALDLFAAACRNNTADQGLLANYHQTIEAVRHAADEAFGKEDFATSGRAYYELLNNYTNCQKLNRKMASDKEVIHARLKDCGTNLSKQALAEYRKGNLAEAITLWRCILVFDPQSEGIKKAIDTASIQMKSLEQNKK